MNSIEVLTEDQLTYSKGITDKNRYKIKMNEKIYWVLDWENLEYPIVYDDNIHNEISKENWYLCPIYAKNNNYYLHHRVMTLNNVFPTNNQSIDHINEYKLDNRFENLRVVTQSEQNVNRSTRSDKIEPLNELKAIGVQEYPRHVRWDKSESKFVIDNHPFLKKEVAEGKRKKAILSGTKSAKRTITEKYQDILAKLKELDEAYYDDIHAEFKEKKNKLREEYIAIVKHFKTNYGL